MKINKEVKFYAPLVFAVLIVVGWAIFFHYVSPTILVDKIGVKNSYLVVFILAVICGFSSLTTSTFYVAVAAAASGGANWFILGLAGGIGLCMSDFAFYYVLGKGTPAIDTHWKKLTNFLKKWIARVPCWVMQVFVLLYSAFSPAPNDVVLAALAVAEVKFKEIAPWLFAGDIIATLLLAYFAH